MLAAAALAIAAFGPAPARAQDISPFDWTEDARWLRTEFRSQHVAPFHARSEAAYDSAFDRLVDWIPRLDVTGDHAVIVGLARAVNAVGDGHSGIRLFADEAIAFHALPIRVGAYPEGLFVEAAGPGHADLVGARLIRVGALPAERVLDLVAPLIARDNDMDVLRFGPSLLVMAEVLHALGVVSDPGTVPVTLRDGGAETTVTLAPGPEAFRLEGHGLLDRRSRSAGWVEALAVDAPAGASTPLLFRDPERDFWTEWLADGRALYAQINRIGDSEGEGFGAFSERLIAEAETRGAERLILDLRWNRGGNGYLIRPLVRSVVKSRFDEPGRLYVLIGRHTFSAAQMLVNELSRLTSPIYVGEPTAAAPNAYGDNRKLTLPHSGITVRASYLWWQQRDPRDDRACTAPHVQAPLGFEDYRAGRDPALEAALAWTGPAPEDTAEEDDAGAATARGNVYEAFLCRNGAPRVGTIF